MGIFIIILIFLIIIVFLSSLKKDNNTSQKTNTNFIKNEVFKYELKGIFYNNYKTQGEFYGYAKTTPDSHDKYCVGIYIENRLAGYTPKGNYRLYNYLNNTNNNLICWGSIGYDNFQNQYYGVVNIPINFTDEEISNTEKAFNLIQTQKLLFLKDEKTIPEYFSILENDTEIEKLLSNKKIRKDINYTFNLNTIPQLSKKLEESKDWNNLIYLNRFQKQINGLSEKFKNSTLKRIEKAKSTSNTQTG